MIVLAAAALAGCADRPAAAPGAPVVGLDATAVTASTEMAVPATVIPTTPTPGVARLTRLTEPGCCPLPFWSADSRSVLFWNQPADGETGVYSVPVTGGAMTRVADAPSGVHRGGAFTHRMDGDAVVLTRTADGQQWRFDTGGEGVLVSHDLDEVAWARETRRSIPGQAPAPLRHFVADLATGAERQVEVPANHGLVDWTHDGAWVLARNDRATDQPTLVRFDLATGAITPLFQAARPRTIRPSTDGRWLAVTRTMEPNPADNGLYIVATDGATELRRIEPFGGYRWRDGGRLLLVPLEPGIPAMRLLEIDAASGATRDLAQPDVTPFRIAAGEWSVAPDGGHVAFRSADDDAVWVLELPRDVRP